MNKAEKLLRDLVAVCGESNPVSSTKEYIESKQHVADNQMKQCSNCSSFEWLKDSRATAIGWGWCNHWKDTTKAEYKCDHWNESEQTKPQA